METMRQSLIGEIGRPSWSDWCLSPARRGLGGRLFPTPSVQNSLLRPQTFRTRILLRSLPPT